RSFYNTLEIFCRDIFEPFPDQPVEQLLVDCAIDYDAGGGLIERLYCLFNFFRTDLPDDPHVLVQEPGNIPASYILHMIADRHRDLRCALPGSFLPSA